VLRVACASDQRYVPHAATMLRSVLAHASDEPVSIHYLHGPGFPAGARDRLTTMVREGGGEISFHHVPDDRVAGMPSWAYIPQAMWYRVFLPELLPDVDTVLYVDIDTIVLDSLTPLFDLDLGHRYLAAVTNVFQPHERHRPAQLGLRADVYFNSGVLLLNLDAMRRDDCTTSIREYAMRHSERPGWPDQDALNVVLGEGRLPLHPRWNCMNSVLLFPWAADVFGGEAVAEARANPAIRHFEGPAINKPWHYLCDREMREVYLEHRSHTPWARFRLEGATPANGVRRVAREVRRGTPLRGAVGSALRDMRRRRPA
jgi:lipopolysaccharide biosynthesis glycosyltransferase